MVRSRDLYDTEVQVWDTLQPERQQERTIDLHVRSCKTPKHTWTVTDVPGHRRHLKTTIAGGLGGPHGCLPECLFIMHGVTCMGGMHGDLASGGTSRPRYR
jgi:hypothetical protein